MSKNCPQCGAPDVGGLDGCGALYEQFTYQAMEHVSLASMLNLAFDAYCMQHVEKYGISAKSYCAHLTRLCIGVEHAGKHDLYAKLQRWYHAGVTKPDILTERGSIWISDVMAIDDILPKSEKIREWAQNVWDAYASQQDIARQWIREALNSKGKRR